MRALLVGFITLAVLYPNAAVAQESCPQELVCTNEFQTFYDESQRLGEKYGRPNVLLVFDIDNTLLAMDQPLGSDQWLNWQRGLLKQSPLPDAAVAESWDELMVTLRLLFAISHMHPPEPTQPTVLAQLQNQGFPVIAHTSRGYRSRDATRRELRRSGYDLSRNPLPPRPGFPSDPYLPYSPGDLAASGLTLAEVTALGLGEPRPVSYRNGIYMTAGQHKGAMLRMLLHRTDADIKAIVFLDDHARNVRNMINAFPTGTGIELSAFVFTREAANVQAFDSPEARAKVTAKWERLEDTLNEVFPSRATGFFAK